MPYLIIIIIINNHSCNYFDLDIFSFSSDDIYRLKNKENII